MGKMENRDRYAETPIPSEVMEVLADVLLVGSGRDEDHPAYDEGRMRRRRRRAAQAEEYFGVLLDAQRSVPSMDTEAALAGLTQTERTVWEMYSEGSRASSIARSLHIPRPTVVRLLKSAARRIAAGEFRFKGMHTVYYQETHRHTYRKPTHCSEQPCRRLGYCRYPL